MREIEQSFEVLRLKRPDMPAFRDIRREAIESHPDAFGMSLGEELTHGEAWYLDRLDAEHVFGGHNQSGALMGVVVLTRRRIAGRLGVASLSGVDVRSAARGTGLSRLLLEAAITEAFKDCHSILLAVTIANKPAVRLYLSRGFQEWRDFQPKSGLEGSSPPQLIMKLDWERIRTPLKSLLGQI